MSADCHGYFTQTCSSSQALDKDHSSVEGRFEAMLRYWVKRSSPLPSWGSLIKALQSPVMNRGDIAGKIKSLQVSSENYLLRKPTHS